MTGSFFNFTNMCILKYKRPMGHIAHLRKQFKSINTYDYIITLIKRRKKNIIKLMRINCFFIWRNMNPLQPRMLCAKFGWNWPSGFGEEVFLISSVYFSLFRNYLPLEKGRALHFNKLESPSPKNALCQVWLKLAQWFWRRRWKCEKFTDRQTDRRTDGRRTTGDQKSSLELSAQVS